MRTTKEYKKLKEIETGKRNIKVNILKLILNLVYAYIRNKARTKDKVVSLKDDKDNLITDDSDMFKLLNM